jgi:hypothetical protein
MQLVCRYAAAGGVCVRPPRLDRVVGRCKLNPVDPYSLKAPGFKPLPLEYQSWFQNVPFKFNLRRYSVGEGAFLPPGGAAGRDTQRGGAVQVDSP